MWSGQGKSRRPYLLYHLPASAALPLSNLYETLGVVGATTTWLYRPHGEAEARDGKDPAASPSLSPQQRGLVLFASCEMASLMPRALIPGTVLLRLWWLLVSGHTFLKPSDKAMALEL